MMDKVSQAEETALRILLSEQDEEMCELREVLEPFARLAGAMPVNWAQHRRNQVVYALWSGVSAEITVDDCRRAARVLGMPEYLGDGRDRDEG
jgi:hypothetical protein